jgi:enediyne biosynthesis protein E4
LESVPAVVSAPSWGDYDNDGWLDFFIPTYHVPGQSAVAANDLLFHNNGDGTFTRVTEGEIVNTPAFSQPAAWGDYDNDGFLDLYVANGHETAQQANFLYHNDGNSNRWLTIKCVGAASNRSGIGTKLRLKARIGGVARWQLREMSSGNGFNASGLRAYFGLGDATNVDVLRVEWPSGIVQELKDLPVNQILIVKEAPALMLIDRDLNDLRMALKAARNRSYEIQYSTNLAQWLHLKNLTTTNTVTVFSDQNAALPSMRFYRAIEHD